MASFKICIRGRRSDGLFPVYIRLTHNRKIGYIRTSKTISKEGIKKGEVIDPTVLAFCSKQIIRYNDYLNNIDLDGMVVSEIIGLLKGLDDDISFSEYAKFYIHRMALEWKMERNSKTYRLAIQSLENHLQSKNILFAQLSSQSVQGWISYLDMHTHRAKEQYPTCVRIMFRAALDDYNDYEKGIIRIKNDPFKKIRIPKADTPEKRAVDVDLLKRFFRGELPNASVHRCRWNRTILL